MYFDWWDYFYDTIGKVEHALSHQLLCVRRSWRWNAKAAFIISYSVAAVNSGVFLGYFCALCISHKVPC